MENIRVAYIDSGDPDAPEGTRLKLGLSRVESPSSKEDIYQWWDLTNAERIESPPLASVAQAMSILFAWYDAPGWHLTTRHHTLAESR